MAQDERIFIFDTTLRDGEQSPGASMTTKEKLMIAEALDSLGVDIIEAGFAIASPGDFEAVNQIAQHVKNATVCSLARAVEKDIEAAAEAIKPAKKRRIHTFISTSPIHMKHKLRMEPEKVVEAIRHSVSFARKFTDDVEWSCEDGSRTEPDFLCRVIEAAIDAGAGTINIPDTVGYTIPSEYAATIRMVKERVPNIDKAVISVHCHNDLGLAVANSLAAVEAGARQVECTINGIGERAGNAALEEIVMGLKVRHDKLPYVTNIKAEQITRTSRLVSSVTGLMVQNNKAIVGANAFAHESGIHQDGMLKHAQTYEIMTPESVGQSKTSLVMGKHSGRHAFSKKLDELGFQIDDELLEAAFERFKKLADKKKEVYDEDIIALLDPREESDERIQFQSLQVVCGATGPHTAWVELVVDGQETVAKGEGQGPVDAIFKAIRRIVPFEAELKVYQVGAVTEGTDAQAEVSVRLEAGKMVVNGNAKDTDTLVASARAYVNAINNLERRQARLKESFTKEMNVATL